MFVRDIVERPTSKPTAPGAAPTPPAQGFPLAAHRSTRPKGGSAFARAERDKATRQAGGLAPGEGRVVDSVPTVRRNHAGKPKGEAEEVRHSVDAENARRVAGMSPAEREQEADELKERFGPGLVGLMQKRRAARETQPESSQEFTSPSPELPKVPVTRNSLSKEQPTEQTEIERLPVVDPESSAAAPKNVRPRVRFSDKDSTPSAIRKKYFPDESEADAKLEWMKSSPQPSSQSQQSDSSPRFDLAGEPLSPETANALPTHLGLHHHGESPDLAGYTLAEISHLCYSTVTSQRITMMGVLSKLLIRYHAAIADSKTSQSFWVTACRENGIVGKGIEAASSVLMSHTRSVGLLVAAVNLLFATLGGPNWTWMDDVEADRVVPFHPEPICDGEPTGIAAVPFEDLLPRLQDVLAFDKEALPSNTLEQLIRILRRAALNSPSGAEAIVSLVPPIIRTHVLRSPWPLDPSYPPDVSALRLLHDVVISSRESAAALVRQGLFEPLLKFVASTDLTDDGSKMLLGDILRIFYSLGRYGLSASLATSAREVWSSLGQVVAEECSVLQSSNSNSVIAYFNLLRVWTVCAIDPHRTTPEHDLTWAQVTALQWADEELSAARALCGTGRWAEIAAVLSALVEYVTGVGINGVRAGADEKTRILSALQDMGLVGSLPQGVSDVPNGDDRPAFNAALTQVFRLHNVLSSGPSDSEEQGCLLMSPEKERLLWWSVATTQSSTEDVYLRHALLVTARTDKVISLAHWATSAFDLALSFQAGDEPLALSLVDDILRANWQGLSEAQGVTTAIQNIGHSDGLQILRPLLHHAILPDLEGVLGPRQPSYLYLKATGSLRPPAPTEADAARGPGLPLPPDWVYAPLNELLASGTSPAFTLAPPDWDVTETQLTRATLALARLRAATSSADLRSLTLLNCMKVFMLEHGQQDAPNTDADVFRDAAVGVSLTALLDSTAGVDLLAPQPPSAPLQTVAKRFLGPGVPFFQFYTDLLALYESVSFGDSQFGRVILPPLAMTYPVDYRKLLWAEQPDALRSLRLTEDQVPLEAGTPAVYFSPLETDREVLNGYARALVTGTVQKETSTFLFRVAVHHLAGLFWQGTDEERSSTRLQLLVVVLSSASDGVLRAIVESNTSPSPGTSSVADSELQQRLALVQRLAGPRGAQRLAQAGYV